MSMLEQAAFARPQADRQVLHCRYRSGPSTGGGCPGQTSCRTISCRQGAQPWWLCCGAATCMWPMLGTAEPCSVGAGGQWPSQVGARKTLLDLHARAHVMERAVKIVNMHNKEAAITGNRKQLPQLSHLGAALLSAPGRGEVAGSAHHQAAAISVWLGL